MALWDKLLSQLGWQDDSPTTDAVRRPAPSSSSDGRPPHITTPYPGAICRGKVEFVGSGFAKVSAGGIHAVVFLIEMATNWISTPADVLSQDDTVDFVLTKPNYEYKPGEWIASIAAVPEARARHKLSRLEHGCVIHGTVVDIKESGVVLECDEFNAWIPTSELAWHWIEHPSDVVGRGDKVAVEVLSVKLPDGWLSDKRARRAQAVVSLRRCLPRSKSPVIQMPFSCVPFKIWSVPRTSRNCDPIVLHVLEELVHGYAEAEIRAATGLAERTLNAVLDLLEDEGLADARTPSPRGRRLVEAIAYCRELNADPIRGLFASAAHPSARFLRFDDIHALPDYPRSWPRPPFNGLAEGTFTRATDEELPEELMQRVANEEQRAVLVSLQKDDRIRVFLRRDGLRPWQAAYVPVPEHWVLAGLWAAFDSVGVKPCRPIHQKPCKTFLMLRLVFEATVEDGTKTSSHLYLEPSTRTSWIPRSTDHLQIREIPETVTDPPALPNLEGSSLPSSGAIAATAPKPDCWCIVSVRV